MQKNFKKTRNDTIPQQLEQLEIDISLFTMFTCNETKYYTTIIYANYLRVLVFAGVAVMKVEVKRQLKTILFTPTGYSN